MMDKTATRRPAIEDFSDHKVRLFLESLARDLTYTQMAERCLDRFGKARAWSRDKIRSYWLATHTVDISRSPIDREPGIRDFIDDRYGRMTIDDIAFACRTTFGNRAPSRSAIGRYVKRLIDQLKSAADC
jgi:hypothetical protein